MNPFRAARHLASGGRRALSRRPAAPGGAPTAQERATTVQVQPVVQAVDPDARRRRKLAEDILASGLFHDQWYREQVPGLDPDQDALEHYVRNRPDDAVSPNPCFSPSWYLSQPDCPTAPGTEAFIHYVRRGGPRGIQPHPLFDAKAYLQRCPEAGDHAGGPLGHYLAGGWRSADREATPGFDAERYQDAHPEVEEAPLLHFLLHTTRRLRQTRGWEHVARTAPTFDRAAGATAVEELLGSCHSQGSPARLVTVILPTRDRREGVLAAVESVVQQTYTSWQLVVVDDGSSDGTFEALQQRHGDDPRIVLVRRPSAGGVATARNEGLVRAAGDHIAYLDSDNTWDARFLEVMVAAVTTTGARFVYAASELREEGGQNRVGYRLLPFNREALYERNYIDCIVVLHERSLLEEVGHFDESLRREVHWDLFIRMAKVTDFREVPYIATTYDPWEKRSDRIASNEPLGYRFKILDKHHVDWEAAASIERPDGCASVSVVLHAHREGAQLVQTVRRLLEVSGPELLEVVVVDAKLPEVAAVVLRAAQTADRRLRVVRNSVPLSAEVARNIGAARAKGRVIVFVTDETRVEQGWLQPLQQAVEDPGVPAAQPKILQKSGAVWSTGVAYARQANPHQVFFDHAGDSPEACASSARQGLSSRVVAVRAGDLVAVKGFEALLVNDHDSSDLSLRLAALRRGDPVYCADSSVSLTGQPQRPGKRSRSRVGDNFALFRQRHGERVRADARTVAASQGFDVVGYTAASPAHPGFDPVLVRQRAHRPRRWAIKIGAPDVGLRDQWGDWHFGVALKEALERQGQEVVVDCEEAWYRSSSRHDDVTLALRGVSPVTVNPQHLNLMWVISHPERVTVREAQEYDHVFAASLPYAARLSEATGRPVTPLLQATDAYRFRPDAGAPAERHEVLFVGNARGMRPSVQAAIEAGIMPSVYGVRWKGLVPDDAWLGEYLPNDVLPSVYAAAGVVLNDHWDDMRREGLLSNRLFDLAACGARIVTDDAPGLREVFGEAVMTFTTPEELAAAVDRQLHETEGMRARRLQLSETVRQQHSFDARARQLVEQADRLEASAR